MSIKIIVSNRKVYHEYEVLQTQEAGIALQGTEVKSLRAGKVNLGDAYCRVTENMEVWLMNAHIAPYDFGNIHNHDPLRERALLLHKNEIRRLYGQVREKGLALVPTKLYFKNGRVKIEIALAKGKKLYDKRESLKKKESQRDMARAVSS